MGILLVDYEGWGRGTLIDKEYRGKSLGRELLPDILNHLKMLYANGKLPFDTTRSRVHKDNIGAIKVMTECGYTIFDTDGDFALWEYRLTESANE